MRSRARVSPIALSLAAFAASGCSGGSAGDNRPTALPPSQAERAEAAEVEAAGADEASPEDEQPEVDAPVSYRTGDIDGEALRDAAIEEGVATSVSVPQSVRDDLPPERVCEKPAVHECAMRAMELERAGDERATMEHYAGACRAGSSLACGNLAHGFTVGEGVEADPQRAIRLLRYACRAGQLTNCPRLAVRVAAGCETDASHRVCTAEDVAPSEVMSSLEDACAGGAGIACSGGGVIAAYEGDWDAAADFYDRGCELGDGFGCHNLADIYLGKGGEMPTNPLRAAELHRRGCDEARFSSSCMKLAMLKLQLTGDTRAAARRMGQACEHGELQACEMLRELGVPAPSAGASAGPSR